MTSFALIGAAGYVAPRHMKAIKAVGGDLKVAFDPNDSVGVIDSHFPDAHFFTEFERFDRHIDKMSRRGEKIDYISICSPNYLHDAHCRFAMRSNADAICEKPLAQPALQGILGQVGSNLNNTGLTGQETGAINTLEQNAGTASQYAPQIQSYATNLLNGGGATNQAGAQSIRTIRIIRRRPIRLRRTPIITRCLRPAFRMHSIRKLTTSRTARTEVLPPRAVISRVRIRWRWGAALRRASPRRLPLSTIRTSRTSRARRATSITPAIPMRAYRPA